MTRRRLALMSSVTAAASVFVTPAAASDASGHIATIGRGAVAAGGTLLTEPRQGYQPVDAFILGAKKSVDMTMYELSDPSAEAALGADAHRGVDVRVVMDKDYSGGKVNAPAYAYLASHGVHVVWSYPHEIFHQKTITVDGTESLVLTGNLTSRYYTTTRDFGVFDTNTSDVSAIEAAFSADFAGNKPAPAGAGADLVWSPGSETALVALINSAQHTLTIENEEMDSTTIESAIEAAARRGVETHVTMTYSSDWTAALDQLMASGVKVRLYHGETPIYVHAKVISVDAGSPHQRAFIGSENFSNSSLRYNRELGLIAASPAILTPLNATLQSDFVGTATR